MIKQDDRTSEQKQSHTFAVVARDKFMSGWGNARNGSSRCGWACPDMDTANQLLKWVQNRSEMRNVNLVDLRTYRAPRGTAHFHIYVAGPDHPALRLATPN